MSAALYLDLKEARQLKWTRQSGMAITKYEREPHTLAWWELVRSSKRLRQIPKLILLGLIFHTWWKSRANYHLPYIHDDLRAPRAVASPLANQEWTPTFEPPSSWDATPFWTKEVEEDRHTQRVLEDLFLQRQFSHVKALNEALESHRVRNERVPGVSPPVTIYWPEPPPFWSKWFGNGKGEHIEMKDCPVSCELVSGIADDTNQQKSHMLLQYNILRGTILGLKDGQRRRLLPFQKSVVYSMEPNTFAPYHQSRLQLFDIVASFSRFSEIPLQTYVRRLPYLRGNLGIADIDSDTADQVWGSKRDKVPIFRSFEGFLIPEELKQGPVRLPTFISNCAGGSSRNRFIQELVKEGVKFDHYGKCNETFFGGDAPPYDLGWASQLKGSRQMTKLAILSLYPFNLVLENTILSDYVSEKVTEGLLAGGIPIVLGAPNLGDKLQPPNSPPVFIDALRHSPREIATLLGDYQLNEFNGATYRSWIQELPKQSPVLDYMADAKAHDYTKNGTHLAHPICKLCEFYHKYYDWQGDAPLSF